MRYSARATSAGSALRWTMPAMTTVSPATPGSEETTTRSPTRSFASAASRLSMAMDRVPPGAAERGAIGDVGACAFVARSATRIRRSAVRMLTVTRSERARGSARSPRRRSDAFRRGRPVLGVGERAARLLERVRRLRVGRQPPLEQPEAEPQFDHTGDQRADPHVTVGDAADQGGDEHRQRNQHDDRDAEGEAEPQRATGGAVEAVLRFELGELDLVRDQTLGVVGEAADQVGDSRVRVDHNIRSGSHTLLREATRDACMTSAIRVPAIPPISLQAERLDEDLGRECRTDGAGRATSRLIHPESDRAVEGSAVEDANDRAGPDAELGQIAQPLGVVVHDLPDAHALTGRGVPEGTARGRIDDALARRNRS